MDCSAEWLWQGSPYRHTTFSPSGGPDWVTLLPLFYTCVTLSLFFQWPLQVAELQKYLQIHSSVTTKTDTCTPWLWYTGTSWAGGICAEDSVLVSGTDSKRPQDQADHQSRLCLICLTRESLAHGAAVLSSYALGPTHYQAPRMPSSPIASGVLLKMPMFRDHTASRSEWETGTGPDELGHYCCDILIRQWQH